MTGITSGIATLGADGYGINPGFPVRGRNYAPITAGQRMVAFGDSITDAGSDYSVGASKYLRYNDYGWWCWAQRLMDYPWEFGFNAGVSGEKTFEMLDRLESDVLAYDPGWVLFLGGTNDVYTLGAAEALVDGIDRTAAGTMYRIEQIAQRCIDAGAIFVMQTIWARSDAAVDADRFLQHMLLNDMIREYARRTRGVYLVDAWNVTVDPSDTAGAEKTDYLYDNLHPSNLGAYIVGKEVARVISPLVGPPDALVSSYADTITNNASGNNLFTDAGFFLTSEASASTGMSGNEAASWTISRASGTPTSVNSLQTHPDGYGNRQRMVITAGANGDAVQCVYTAGTTLKNNFAVGDWVYCECEVVVASPTALKGLELQLAITDSDSSLNQNVRDNAYLSGSAVDYPEAFSCRLRTPWYQVPSGAVMTNVHPLITATFSGAGGATIDIGRMSIRRASTRYEPFYQHD